MPTGLKVPVGIGSGGGAALVSGDTQNQKVIALALSDCENAHAWLQELGLGVDMIFRGNDPTVQARIMMRIGSIFQRFAEENRFRLQSRTVQWSRNAEGELTLSFKYLDLESDEEKPFFRTFKTVE